jgi:hypothetical protein
MMPRKVSAILLLPFRDKWTVIPSQVPSVSNGRVTQSDGRPYSLADDEGLSGFCSGGRPTGKGDQSLDNAAQGQGAAVAFRGPRNDPSSRSAPVVTPRVSWQEEPDAPPYSAGTVVDDNAARVSHAGIAIVMPAYREEENLAATVADFLQVAGSLSGPHTVIVVNDGSTDRTGEIADQLAAQHPGRVLAVHHEVNRGYGPSISTGIVAALRLDHRWVFLTDSDGQFRARQLPEFVETAYRERADVVVGYRPRRADPRYRRINASLWTAASRLLVRVRVRDVDCAYKLIDRRCLDGMELTGKAATISPELIAKLRLAGARILERPVDHFSREHGEQTGAKPSVIIRSLLGLLALSTRIADQRAPGRVARRLLHPRDAVLAAITVAAAGASVAALLYFTHRQTTLAYPDAVSHLLITRRVIDSPTAGVAQLGAAWLPLPHLLALPFIWVTAWYYSGLAGSVVSMAAYVLAVRYSYLISVGITRSRIGGIVAAIAVGANPNVLYMQSTPMTELLLIACIAATVYYLMRWCQEGRYVYLAATGAWALLGSLTRYEGWVLCVSVMLIVILVARRRWHRYQATEAHVIFYGCLAMSGIAGWILWNAVIFHDALYFQTGQYTKPSLWVSHADRAIGHLGLSALTYLYAVVDNAGTAAVLLAAFGFVMYLARTRLATDTIAPTALLAFVPFYVYAIYAGQRPLHVTQINGNLYNVRFGLLMVLPIAIFMAYLVTLIELWRAAVLRRAGVIALVLGTFACSGLLLQAGIATQTEAVVFRSSPAERANLAAAHWLRTHYSGGMVLMESFGNETVTFWSHIPLGHIVYEGSFHQWAADLADPAGHGIRWIVMRMRPGPADQVFRRLHGTASLAGYRLVYQDTVRLVYERRGPAARPLRSPPRARGRTYQQAIHR